MAQNICGLDAASSEMGKVDVTLGDSNYHYMLVRSDNGVAMVSTDGHTSYAGVLKEGKLEYFEVGSDGTTSQIGSDKAEAVIRSYSGGEKETEFTKALQSTPPTCSMGACYFNGMRVNSGQYVLLTDASNASFNEFTQGAQNDQAEFTQGARNGYADFAQGSDDAFAAFAQGNRDAFAGFAQGNLDGFNDDASDFRSQFNSFKQGITQEYEDEAAQQRGQFTNTQGQNQASFDALKEEAAAQREAFLAAKAEYEQNGYKGFQDYSSQADKVGLNGSEVLSQTQENRTHSLETFGGGISSYTTYEQTEFRQASNGFALMHNNEMRSVVVEGQNLHFQVTENGTTRDMTANEATQFMKDVRSAGAQVNGEHSFNDKLFKTVENHKALTDARGTSHYAAEPRGSGGDTHTHARTTTPVSKGRE